MEACWVVHHSVTIMTFVHKYQPTSSPPETTCTSDCERAKCANKKHRKRNTGLNALLQVYRLTSTHSHAPTCEI